MSASAFALLGYITWTLALIITNEVLRSYMVMSGRKESSTFSPDGKDVSPFAHRLARAHANCYESFPIIAGPLLLALVTGQTSVTDSLALWVLAARVAQSGVHLVSAGNLAVNVRFTFFAAQLIIVTWWVVQFWLQWPLH